MHTRDMAPPRASRGQRMRMPPPRHMHVHTHTRGFDFAIFTSFAESLGGGSPCAIVAVDGHARALTAEQMQRVAREIGAPATGFVQVPPEPGRACAGVEGARVDVDVRFFSTQTEYGMCGHGTLGLMTWLVERGVVPLSTTPGSALSVGLHTPAKSSTVDLTRRPDGRVEVMLTLSPTTFEPCDMVPAAELAPLLGFDTGAGSSSSSSPAASSASTEGVPLGLGAGYGLPIEVARGDFTHLIIPVMDMVTINSMTPNYAAVAALCRRRGIDTVAFFTLETEHRGSTVHVRELAPAVGTDEVAATGTTNCAIACYLARHGRVPSSTARGDGGGGSDGSSRGSSRGRADQPGTCETTANGVVRTVLAEQGYAQGRPSTIRSELTLRGDDVVQVRVGGVRIHSLWG